MLKKLIKYDFIKMFYVLPYFYIVTLFLAGLTRLFSIWKDIQFLFILGQVFQGATIALMINCLINALTGILIRSFRNSFYSDEGYLTHTLPVSKNQLILSKFISALLVLLLTFVVIFLSLIIAFYSSQLVEIIKQALSQVVIGLNISPLLLIILFVFAVFFQLLTLLLVGFSAIVKGYSYNNGKIAKSFIWFAIYYIVSSIVSLAVIALVLLISGNVNEIFATVMKAETFIILLISALVIYMGHSATFYFLTNKLFNKGVNID